ncbi:MULTISPECIES: hypothetical protein [Corynebacterium]|uniref:hypothetical protein n=1 Tax=Corynebacterium TaxID=1716 RepID=UPI0025439182|nr:hypothetical protein [Corynebacterium accolens]MDK4295476.1 hypothetical protein [Corynebacterium accolens]
MSSKTIIPSYMTPVYQLMEGVRAQFVPEEPEQRDGREKESPFFPGCKAWKIQVALTMSEEEVDNGAVEREIRRQAVTVWVPTRPTIYEGEKIRFIGLMAGAVDGTLFFQAQGVESVEEVENLD